MNERIRELANQMFSMEQFEYAEEFLNDEFMEKFAESIVQDCADLFEVEWGEEKLTGNDVGYVVKKHFGVESQP